MTSTLLLLINCMGTDIFLKLCTFKTVSVAIIKNNQKTQLVELYKRFFGLTLLLLYL